MSIDGAGVDLGIEAPDLLQEMHPGQQLPRVLQHVGRQLELLTRQAHSLAMQLDGATLLIDGVGTELKHLRHARAAGQRLDPSQKLESLRRLDQVIVGAVTQRGDDIHLIVPRGDEDHRYIPAQIGPDPAQHLLTAALRQHPVDQQQVKALIRQGVDEGLRRVETPVPVPVLGGLEPVLIEHLLGRVVFENSDVHVKSWPRSVGCPSIITANRDSCSTVNPRAPRKVQRHTQHGEFAVRTHRRDLLCWNM